MSGIDVDLGELLVIASGLDTAANGLEALADSVPAGIDAGLMTGIIASMMSQMVDSTANVSAVLNGCADTVRTCRTYYQRADASVDANFKQITTVMDDS